MSAWQMCHAEGCDQAPLNELGAPVPVDVKRWWCGQHRHLAAPGDLEPHGSGVRMSLSGALVPVDEAEQARAAAEAESRHRLNEDRRAERQVEAAEHAESERLRAEAFRRELGPGVRG